MIKRNLKKIIMILFIVIFGIFFIDSYMSTGVEEDFFTDIYLYLWNGNLNIVFLLVFLAIFHELCVMDSYKKIYNHFDRYVITRIGYKNFYKKVKILWISVTKYNSTTDKLCQRWCDNSKYNLEINWKK